MQIKLCSTDVFQNPFDHTNKEMPTPVATIA